MYNILDMFKRKNKSQNSNHSNHIQPAELRLERDKIYNQILKNFETNHRKLNAQRRCQKFMFFWIVCISFIGILVISGYVLLKFTLSNDFSYKNLAAVLGSFATIISSIIILPNVIATHLFPKSGEDIGIDIIKTIQSVDNTAIEPQKFDIDYVPDKED